MLGHVTLRVFFCAANLTCPGNMVYMQCVPNCIRTCDDVEAASKSVSCLKPRHPIFLLELVALPIVAQITFGKNQPRSLYSKWVLSVADLRI